jgi:hypothetical protein
MITSRTLLIYNFGIALTFVVIGLLSLLTFEHLLSRPVALPPFDPASSKAIQAEPDLEKLRSQALFYFELGRDLKRARYSDTDTLVHDFRFLCFLLSVVFAVGGMMAVMATRAAAAPRATGTGLGLH